MYQVTVISPWIGAGTRGNPYRPQLIQDYPSINCSSISGSPFDPTCTVIAIVPDQPTADALGADPTYNCSDWILIGG